MEAAAVVEAAVAARHLEPRHLGDYVEDVHLLVHRDDAELDEEPDDEVAHLQQRALERRVRALAVATPTRQRRRRQHRRKDDILGHVEERLAVAPRQQGEEQSALLVLNCR